MAQERSDEAEVLEVVGRLNDALERHDLQAALSLCTDDVVFIGSGEGEQAVGQEAVVRMAMELGSRSADTDFTVTDSSVDVRVHGHVATVTAFGTAHLESPRCARTGPYRLTGSLVKKGGAWKWFVHHGSEPLPW
jgi:uncharacterized protein (TIGR02246 family)